MLELLQISRSTLQLVGVTCIWIASKYEEIHAPLVDDFVYITDNTYSRQEILTTELIILRTLKFKLTMSTIKNFLVRFLILAGVVDQRVIYHASFLAELILPFYSIIRRYRPSLLAAAILCISKQTFGLAPWTVQFEHYSRYRPQDLRQCIQEIFEAHKIVSAASAGKLTAAREKYRQHKFFSVSEMKLASLPPF